MSEAARTIRLPVVVVLILSSLAFINFQSSKRKVQNYAKTLLNYDELLDMISQDIGIDGSSHNSTGELLTRLGGEASKYLEREDNMSTFIQQDKAPIIRARAPNAATTHISSRPVDNFLTKEYRKRRIDTFDTWFKTAKNRSKFIENADEKGPLLDFVIAGFPKCGTTTMSANLRRVAPMPSGDFCKGLVDTVRSAYTQFPIDFPKYAKKLLRGSKCPSYIGPWLSDYSIYLPRTKVIIGIRHPVLWFQSFWNMQASKGFFGKRTPYNFAKPCKSTSLSDCRRGCPNGESLCVHRGRFHLTLAALGKTALGEEERRLLAPGDLDGGANLKSNHIRNEIFLYEQSELKQDYVWEELANYLNVDKFENANATHSGRSKGLFTDFCEEKYDDFRAMVMPYAYDLSTWMQDYFIPVAKNESSDVTIPNPDRLIDVVEGYKKDPCGRLYRSNDGKYLLDINRTAAMNIARI